MAKMWWCGGGWPNGWLGVWWCDWAGDGGRHLADDGCCCCQGCWAGWGGSGEVYKSIVIVCHGGSDKKDSDDGQEDRDPGHATGGRGMGNAKDTGEKRRALFLYWPASRCAKVQCFLFFFFGRRFPLGGWATLPLLKHSCFYTGQLPDLPMARF